MEISSVSSDVGKDEFLRLFVAQLKNQSPMDPLKGHEFIAQLAQFSSLEQLTNLNASFSDMLKFEQLLGEETLKQDQFLGIGNLIGMNAEYIDPASETGSSKGVISGITTRDDTIYLVMQNKEIPISEVTGIFQ